MEKVYLEKIVLFLFMAFFSTSCTDHKKIFSKFEEKYNSFELDSFILFESTKFQNFIDYDLTMADSNKILSFTYIIKDYEDVKKGNIYFDNYQEKKRENDTIYVSAFDENRKLLYSFKHNENRYVPTEDAIFIKGKYYYYYTYLRGRLDHFQRAYFESNQDSITNNLVNEIPTEIGE